MNSAKNYQHLDARSLTVHRSRAQDCNDFAAQKAREFLIIQESLSFMDFNISSRDSSNISNSKAE